MYKSQKNRFFTLLVYALLLLFTYFIQSARIMFPVSGVYPNLVLALLIVVSMFENDYTAAIFGLFCGMLVDTVSVNGSGFHALTYMVTGFLCSLLIELLFQNNFASFAVISVPVLVIHQILEIVTKGTIGTGVLRLFTSYYILVALYSFVVCFIFYLLFYFVIKKNERFKKPIGILPKIKIKTQNRGK